MSLARDRPSPGLCRRLNQSQEEFPDHPASGTKAVPDRVSPARVRHNARFENLSRMNAVFLEGKAVIEATPLLHRPVLLILDPLVRLHAIDENAAGEIAALLGYLRLL